MSARRPGRTPLMLAGVVLAAAAAFWLLRGGGAPDLTGGGPLLATDLRTVESLQLTARGVPYRFDRVRDSLWTLSGAVRDWVDPLRLSQQLAALGGAVGGRLLPGTEPGDRRYEFNGPDAVHLTLFGPGSEERLALGAVNPVTGFVYASGAGRPACFPVQADLRDRLAGLPDAVRLATLLPPVPLADLERITAVRGRRTTVLAAQGGRWWLRVPGEGLANLPPLAQDWQRLYDDRRRRDDEGLWYLADERKVALLAYEVGQLQVERFVAPARAAAALADWQLDPPWLTVTLAGAGIDPDPTSEDADRLVIGFGPPLAQGGSVPAVRRGNPLVAPPQALATVEAPPGDLLHLFAFTARPLLADEVEIADAAGPLLKARRVDREFRNDERTQWEQLLPPPDQEVREHLTARNVVVDLDRLAVLAVLPPTDARRVLRDEGRITVTVRWREPARSEVWVCGRLDPDNVPGGAALLAPADDGEGPVGFWRPADGRLLQVPSTLLVTARNLRR